jgi:uncharacterized protein (DUF2267 family)
MTNQLTLDKMNDYLMRSDANRKSREEVYKNRFLGSEEMFAKAKAMVLASVPPEVLDQLQALSPEAFKRVLDSLPKELKALFEIAVSK